MKTLITGIGGFVGKNLFKSLNQSHTVFGLDISSSEDLSKASIFNWSQLESLPVSQTIIHLAGKAHDTSNTSRAQEYFDVNLGLTQKIFDYFLQSRSEKFVFFSSVKAVADSVVGPFLSEETNPNPLTPYGQSKLEAEKYILSKHLPNDKKIHILRPCMIHGPGNKGNLNLLYKIVKSGYPWPLGAFENKRSFLSIENLVFVLKKIIETDIASGIYNVADDECLSTNQLIQLMGDSMKKTPKVWKISPKVIMSTSKIGDILHLPLNSERLKKLTESYVVSNCKLKTALGITNMPVTAAEGMINTLQSFGNKA